MDLLDQMVPLIFMLAHFTSSFTSCVAPLNPYQSQHVMTFYNFPEQDKLDIKAWDEIPSLTNLKLYSVMRTRECAQFVIN
jgi:hypothetical protein